MSSYTVVPANEADVPTLVSLLYDGKISLPVNKLMWKQWPSEIPQKSRIESAVRHSLQDSKHTAHKIVDGEDERTVGLLVLTRAIPLTPDEQNMGSSNDGAKPMLPPELRPDVTETLMAAIDNISKDSASVDRIGWFYPLPTHSLDRLEAEITTLIIEQAVREQGLGTMLMRKAFEWARTDRVPLMVSSEPAAHSFFTKLGFKSFKHADMDLSKYAPPHSGFGTFRMTRMTWSA